jgi:DNA polymerase-1
MAKGRLCLVDASGYVYRAFHALPALNTSRGLPTNATLGFANMVAKLLKTEKPDWLAVVFDAPGETFRDALFAEYKEHRAPMPDDLRTQIPYIRRLVAAMRLPVVEEAGVEADDVIGTLATAAERAGLETVIVTADKDMMQLVSERTTLYDDMRNRRIGIAEVRERFGVDPALVPDVLGLMGDTSDNIPGVTGVGQKTATALVQQLGPVDTILGRLEAVEGIGVRGAKKIRETLASEAETARLSKDLATIRRDLAVALDLERFRWPGSDMETLRPLLLELEFMALLRELTPQTTPIFATVERREVRTPSEVAAAIAPFAKGTAVAVGVARCRARRRRVRQIVLAGPTGAPSERARTRRRCRSWRHSSPTSRPKPGADLKTVRVALARRRLGLAGPATDFGIASYCLNPSRPLHDTAALAHELLGEPGEPERNPVLAAVHATRVAHALRPVVEERLEQAEMRKLYRELEMPLAETLAAMELAGVAL